MKKKNLKIFIAGSYGFENMGDEMILYSILQDLKKNKFFNISVLSGKYNTLDRSDVKIVKISRNIISFLNIINAIKKNDVVIVGGGGIFYDYRIHVIPFWSLIIFLSKILKKKIIIYGVGIGPIRNLVSKLLIKISFSLADKIYVRDNNSKELLEKIGINKKINISYDPAITIDIKKDNVLSKKKGDKIALVCIRPWKNFDKSKQNELLKYLEFLSNNEFKVVFLPFRLKEDYKLSIRFKKLIKNSLLIKTRNVKKIYNIIRESDLLIGMRLHSIILASITNTPFIAISYDEKVSNFCKLINRKYCINLKYLNANILIKKTKNLNLEKNKKLIESKINALRKRIKKLSEILSYI